RHVMTSRFAYTTLFQSKVFGRAVCPQSPRPVAVHGPYQFVLQEDRLPLLQPRCQESKRRDHHFRVARFHRKDERVIVEVTRDPRELERALYHSEWRVAVSVQDPIAERAVIRPDAHRDSTLLAKIDQRREALANSAQLRGILLLGVFTDDKFL